MLLYGIDIWVVTRRDAQGPGRVPSLGSWEDHGDDNIMCGGWGVGVPPGGGLNGSHGNPTHKGVD